MPVGHMAHTDRPDLLRDTHNSLTATRYISARRAFFMAVSITYCDGSSVRLVAEDVGRFAGADVQQVGQGIVRADRVDEITLRALRDQDGGRRRGDKTEPRGR